MIGPRLFSHDARRTVQNGQRRPSSLWLFVPRLSCCPATAYRQSSRLCCLASRGYSRTLSKVFDEMRKSFVFTVDAISTELVSTHAVAPKTTRQYLLLSRSVVGDRFFLKGKPGRSGDFCLVGNPFKNPASAIPAAVDSRSRSYVPLSFVRFSSGWNRLPGMTPAQPGTSLRETKSAPTGDRRRW